MSSLSKLLLILTAVVVVVVPVGTALTFRIVSGVPILPDIFVGILLSLIPWALGVIVLERSGRRRKAAGLRPRHVGESQRELEAVEIGIGLELIAVVVLTATFDLRVGVAMLAAIAIWMVIWLPKATRRLEMRSVVEVTCPPSAAFDFVSDPNNWPLYHPRLELLLPVPAPGIGSTVGALIHRDGHAPFEGYERVITFEPGKRFGTAVVGDPESTMVYEFVPTTSGTRVEYTFRSVRGLASAVSGAFFLRKSLLQRLQDNRAEINARLKTLLEEGQPPSV